MVKIAIISDVHANMPALKEVLADIALRGISEIYCLGDLVDFAPWGNEVIELIRTLKIPCILGNHDERIASDLPLHPLPHHNADETANRIRAINLSKAGISPENKRWLSSLPYNLELTYKLGITFKRILLVHASLHSNEEYIYESSPDEGIAEVLHQRNIDVLVMGHTHQSYIKKKLHSLMVNCGSVGRSKEPDRKASYAVLTLGEHETEAEIVKVDYDVKAVAEAIYQSEIPDFYADFLLKKELQL